MKKKVKTMLAMLLAVALFTAMLPLCASAAVTAKDGKMDVSAARSMLPMVNGFRTGKDAWYWNETNTEKVQLSGLKELTYDYALEWIAQQRAVELVQKFAHVRPNGDSYQALTYNGGENKIVQSWGENIAYGPGDTGNMQSIFVLWSEENEKYEGQGHRRNMLSERFTAIGIACFVYNGASYWVQEFGEENSGLTEKEVFGDSAKPSTTPNATPTAKPTTSPTVTPNPTAKPSTAPTVAPNPTAKPSTPTLAPKPTANPTANPGNWEDWFYIPPLPQFVDPSDHTFVPDPNQFFWESTTPAPTATPAPEPTATPEPSAEPEPTAAPSVPQFTDVKADVWYAEPVKWAAEHNITSGYPDGGFHPDDTCTRAHIVTFLWKVAGAPSVEGDIGFSDVSEDSYYYQAALWAEQSGITSGVGDGLFGSDNSCTREQVVTMLYKAAGSPAVSGDSPFGDLEQGSYYYNAAIWAQQNGIVAGYPDGGFHPSDPCTRAQIMTMLYNYAGK